MKSIRGILILCSALAMTAGVAMAQGGEAPDGGGSRFGGGNQMYGRGPDGRGHPMPGPQMRGRMMHRSRMHRRMHDPIARLLEHQTLLHLSPAQVNNIISIDDKLHTDNKPFLERLMAMRSEMRGMHRGWRGRGGRGAGADSGSAAPSTARRDSAMTIMRSIRQNVWRATAAADAVLTPEQLNTAGNLDHAGHPGPVMFFRRQGQMTAPDGRGGPPHN
jgi:hypothetical protein